jgi:hypothetical protein
MAARRLRADPTGVTERTFQGVQLPPCPLRQCPKCKRRQELRSYVGGVCEQCWSEAARVSCWRGMEMNAFTHATRR